MIWQAIAEKYGVLTLCCVLSCAATRCEAAEVGTSPVPSQVQGLSGCWQGDGTVMKKPVWIHLAAKPIVLGAMLAIDATSTAKNDKSDRYAAHLLFGAGPETTPHPNAQHPVSAFWADSFGGTFAVTGSGITLPDGFDIVYHYPQQTFLNQWRKQGNHLTWEIFTMSSGSVPQRLFAQYRLQSTPCSSTDHKE